jgi:hypothetical protein
MEPDVQMAGCEEEEDEEPPPISTEATEDEDSEDEEPAPSAPRRRRALKARRVGPVCRPPAGGNMLVLPIANLATLLEIVEEWEFGLPPTPFSTERNVPLSTFSRALLRASDIAGATVVLCRAIRPLCINRCCVIFCDINSCFMIFDACSNRTQPVVSMFSGKQRLENIVYLRKNIVEFYKDAYAAYCTAGKSPKAFYPWLRDKNDAHINAGRTLYCVKKIIGEEVTRAGESNKQQF